MKKNNIAENVIKRGKEGVKQNIIEALDEFCDDFADEMWEAAEEIITLRKGNAALRERLEKAVELPFHPDDYHIEFDFARLAVSTGNQGCKIAIPIYAYINCEDENSAEARLAELKGGDHE